VRLASGSRVRRLLSFVSTKSMPLTPNGCRTGPGVLSVNAEDEGLSDVKCRVLLDSRRALAGTLPPAHSLIIVRREHVERSMKERSRLYA